MNDIATNDSATMKPRMSFKGMALPCTAALVLMAAGCKAPSDDASPSTEPTAANERVENTDWPRHGYNAAEQRFSPLAQIQQNNVHELGLAWTHSLQDYRGLEATPIVVDGRMYLTGNWSRVYAFDAATGERLWSHDPEVPGEWARKGCCDVVNRGVAVWQGQVFVATFDGRLLALDAEDGTVLWEVDTIDRQRPYTITGAPRVVRGNVIIGNGGAEFGVRGYITAYDAMTGELAWRFYTVPAAPDGPFEHPELEAAAKTWSEDGAWRETGGGGTAWDSMAYDPELNLLYVGTGNGHPHARHLRSPGGGDNLYLSSILALDADTGRMAWHYQTTPADSWDYTATQSIILADLHIDGKPRQVLMQAPKNGFFYVLDRASGELLSAEKYATATWASHVDLSTGRPVETGQGEYSEQDRLVYPSELGGHNWHSMAFSPQTGLAYIPALEIPWVYSPTDFYLFDLNVPHLDELRRGQPDVDHGGYLRAWDPVRQKLAWEVRLPALINGGVLATAGDLVFQGSQDGYLHVYSATDGTRLHSIFTGVGIIAAPITYAINGTQYIAVLAGYGGATHFMLSPSAAAHEYQNDGRILVFRLGGEAVPLPPKRAAKTVEAAVNPPTMTPDIQRGQEIYLRNCGFCHGMSGTTPLLPDLSRVRVMGYDAFRLIVMEGVLATRGMASFSDVLSEEDLENLYQAIAAGAHNTPGTADIP
ncbi:PQQ-dependent dehydrogenase, methanol/ethanol family [Elongatibacter sediminis]|uniref:PQQ-dependent dehydrogenase, methanol/ethanol family n=1 Tax=Elongatibacter sediminis TaxID=3119006 RepID=A0AAW9RDV6_9GAMM